jgi:hypothetical protein
MVEDALIMLAIQARPAKDFHANADKGQGDSIVLLSELNIRS